MAIERPETDDVRAVIQTTLTDDEIETIIDDAILIADTCISALPAARQKAILKWLTAHLVSSIKNFGGGGVTSDKLGDASRTFSSGHFGKQLASTSYGQQALLMDPNGCLARIGKAKASIEKV